MVGMPDEERAGVRLTNLDQPLFADSGATKRDLVDYLDAMADRLVPVLAERALSVIRVRPGQPPFMQKNLPSYAPESIATLEITTQDGKKVVRYPGLQRPGDAAVVRQPARGRVPPHPVPRSGVRCPHPPGGRPRPTRGFRRLRACGGCRGPGT